VASPLVYEGCVYVLEQISGLVRCLDATTGKPLYRQRLPGAGGFTASPWAAAGKVYCLDQNGLTTVLAAGPKYQLLASNSLDGLFWASAGVAGQRLLLRSANRLYCVGAM
jgi:outer membrane protein assembly factor BamB